MSDPRDREALIEEVACAWRPRGPDGGVRAHPSWHDLDDEGRAEGFEAAFTARQVEAALDPDGLSSAARSVLARIRGAT